MQSAELTITSASNTTSFLSPLENWMPLKYLQFLHQELHFLRVAVTLSRGWKQQQMQIPCHHFIMYLNVRQPPCDNIQSVLPKSTAGSRAAGFDSRGAEEQPRRRCDSSIWQMDSISRKGMLWETVPHVKDWKGKTALDWFLGEGSTLSPTKSYRKSKLPTLRTKVHKVSCRHKAACEEFSGHSWNYLVQGSCVRLVWFIESGCVSLVSHREKGFLGVEWDVWGRMKQDMDMLEWA